MTTSFASSLERYTSLQAHGQQQASLIAYEEKKNEKNELTIKELQSEVREKEQAVHSLAQVHESLMKQMHVLHDQIKTGEQYNTSFTMRTAVDQQDEEDFTADINRRKAIAGKLVERARRMSKELHKLGEARTLRAVQREVESDERPHFRAWLESTGSLVRLVSELRTAQTDDADDGAALSASLTPLAEQLHRAAQAHLEPAHDDGRRLAEHACAQLASLSELQHHPPLLAQGYANAREAAHSDHAARRAAAQPSDAPQPSRGSRCGAAVTPGRNPE